MKRALLWTALPVVGVLSLVGLGALVLLIEIEKALNPGDWREGGAL